MKIKVSVVTVCYNAESVIERTLESVLAQDYFEYEYIIKDGASKDNTNHIIQKYKKKFQEQGKQFHHYISEDNGIYDAMNEAVSYCNGEWIIFMNAGDAFYNETVIQDIFIRGDLDKVDVIYGHSLYDLTATKGIILIHNSEFLEQSWSLGHQSLFTRKSVLLQNPFDCYFKIVADYDQMLRLKKSGYKFCGINMIISEVDRNGISSKNFLQRYQESNYLVKKHSLLSKNCSPIIGLLKQYIRILIPGLERLVFVKNIEKRNILYK